MNCKELKTRIEENTIINPFIIFVYSDNKFLANQYTQAIAKNLNKSIQYVDTLQPISTSNDIFNIQDDEFLRVYNIDKLTLNEDFINEKNLIIITKNVDDKTKSLFIDNIVELPKLESWQIKDYMYSILKDIDVRYIDWLIDNCNNNIYRLQQEADKLNLFEGQEKNILFQTMVDDDAFIDISNKNIFNFTDAIMKKNKQSLIKIYEDIDSIDVEPLGVLTILYQNFKKLIQVWLNKNPTPENTGLSSKQIYAINKLPRVWSQKDLIEIFIFLTEIDYKIKTGLMPMPLLRDYLVIKILSR